MTTNTITAGGASDGLALAQGNDGTLLVQTGPTGAKVNALTLDATGGGALLGSLTQAGIATPKMVLDTAQNTTSGTFIDFTSIPAWVKQIHVLFNGVSTNSTSNILVQAGVTGVPTTSGYVSGEGNQTSWTGFTTGFGVTHNNSAASAWSGTLSLRLMDSATNTWVCSGSVSDTAGSQFVSGGGRVALAGVLNMLRITTVNGTDTFDAGSVNILYEGY